MSDRELLELAAKAAGILLEWDGDPAKWQPMYYEGKTYHYFNPLTDDGDALRLAVKCEIALHHFSDSCAAAMGARFYSEPHGSDPAAAARRAIVRSAAEIGKAMP